MYYFLEIVSLIAIGWFSFHIFKRRTAGNLMELAAILSGFFGSWLLVILYEIPANWIFSNVFSRFGTMAAVGIVAYFTIKVYMLKWLRGKEKERKERFEKRLNLPPWLDYSICGFFCLLVMTFFFVFLLFMATASSAAGDHANVKNNSFLMSLLIEDKQPDVKQPRNSFSPGKTIPENKKVESKAKQENIESVMDQQAQAMSNFNKFFSGVRETVAEKTGAKKLSQNIEALREILSLSQDEKEWLGKSTPEFKRLLNNKQLIAIMKNDRILKLMEEFHHGSMAALYQLGDEPDIIALFDDKEILRSVRNIDLIALRQKVEKYRNEKAWVLQPKQFETAELSSPMQWEHFIKDKSKWKLVADEKGRVTWKLSARYGSVQTEIFGVAKPFPAFVYVYTEAKPSGLMNNTPLKFETITHGYKAKVTMQNESRLKLLLDFRAVKGVNQCRILFSDR